MGAVSRLENGCGFGRWGVDSLSFRCARSGVVERQDARLLIARRRFDPCRRSFVRRPVSVVRHGSLITSRAWFDSRASDFLFTYVPPWSSGCDAGSSARKRGFESRRGFFLHLHLAVGE